MHAHHHLTWANMAVHKSAEVSRVQGAAAVDIKSNQSSFNLAMLSRPNPSTHAAKPSHTNIQGVPRFAKPGPPGWLSHPADTSKA